MRVSERARLRILTSSTQLRSTLSSEKHKKQVFTVSTPTQTHIFDIGHCCSGDEHVLLVAPGPVVLVGDHICSTRMLFFVWTPALNACLSLQVCVGSIEPAAGDWYQARPA